MSSNWPQPDFLAPTTRRPWLVWLWLAASVLVLAAALRDGVEERQVVAQQHQRLVALQRRSASGMRPIGSPGERSRHGDATDRDAAGTVLAAERVMARIDHPWSSVLSALEASPDPAVQWLSLEHGVDGSAVRLEGAAPDAAMALRTANAVAARPGWSSVALTRLQPSPGSAPGAEQGPSPWQFDLRATIDVRQLRAGR